MFQKFSNWLGRIAKGWLILVLFLIEGAFMGYILPRLQAVIEAVSGGVGPIDLLIAPTPAQSLAAIEAYSTARPFYLGVELTADILYPVAYAFFYSLLITFLLQRAFGKESKVLWLNLLPFGAWLFDLFENICIVALLLTFPAQSVAVAGVLMVVNAVKWLFAGLSILSLFFGLGAWVVSKFKK